MQFDFIRLDWLVSPIPQFGILGVGLAGCLYLWISAKMEIRTVRSALASSRESTDAGIRNLSAGLDEIRNFQKADPVPPVPPGALSFNLTKRAQVLRMHRRGETLASIAAALQTPSNEIELLLKLDRIQDARPQ